MEILETIVALAYTIRTAVRPHIGKQSSKESAGKTSSGDEEFAIDEIAERAIEEFIRERNLSIAYYSEGRGLIEFGRPKHMLIIDPIDGTRPSMVGLEGGVVSIAVAPCSRDACLADVLHGCVLELKTDRLFTATKGGPAQIFDAGVERRVELTMLPDLDRMSWSYEIAGRPVRRITDVLHELIDRSSIRGGVFVISGTAFSLTRIVNGQFDAVVDIGSRLLRDYPQFRDEFVHAGLGSPIGLFPYDIAAALLITECAGCTVTDAYGKSLGKTPLLDVTEGNISSLVAASNPVLHAKLLAEIELGVKRLA